MDATTMQQMMAMWQQMALELAQLMEDGKGQDVCVLDISALNSWTDYFVIVTVTSGAQVLEMLRAEKKIAGIPVIFLTGKDDRDSVLKLLALKPDGYLLKTLPREEILKNVEEFFTKKKYSELHGGS